MSTPYVTKDVVRYLYSSIVLPLLRLSEISERDPYKISPVYGSVGFDFIRIYEIETEDGLILNCYDAEPETYYWGIEISREEIESFANSPRIELFSDASRFALTSWGGYIPLKDSDIVVPHPEFHEIPDNIRPK